MKDHAKWLLPLLLMALITPLTPYIDLEIARYFYHTEAQHFSESQFNALIYVYGLVPGQIVMVLSCVGVLFSYLFPACRAWRRHTLFVLLTIAIGGGLITQAVLKDHWGRPRPKQVIEFGGIQKFRPYYRPNFFNQPEPSKSFPCGHCTMGFLFFTFVILAHRFNQKWMLLLTLVFTLMISGAIAYARMAQGGHFFSDVIMAGLIMWLTAIVLETLLFEKER